MPPGEISVISLKIGKIIYYLDYEIIKNENQHTRSVFFECLKKYMESKQILKFVHGFSLAASYMHQMFDIRMRNTIDLDVRKSNILKLKIKSRSV